jgi:hypothetical protein
VIAALLSCIAVAPVAAQGSVFSAQQTVSIVLLLMKKNLHGTVLLMDSRRGILGLNPHNKFADSANLTEW